MTNDNNNHNMTTRSKRKRNDNVEENLVISITNIEDLKEDSNQLLELSEEFLLQEEEEDQIKKRFKTPNEIIPLEMEGFIVPDTEESSSDSSDDEEEEEEDDITKSGRELAEALSSYINNRMEDLDEELTPEKDEIFNTYDSKMKKHFLSLPIPEQDNILKLEENIKKLNNEVVPLRYQLLMSEMDIKTKAIAMRKLNSISNMDSSGGEYYKLSSYIDGLMKIPFGKYQDLPITIKNTPEEITNYMINCSQILDEAVHGHQKAKSQIIQTVGKWISNPQSNGSVFSILGPMGNGKTTLVKEGISKMINRPFEFISLGGATDSCFLDGHSYTYEGAIPGRIVEILKKTKCMNPVIYFDELDKVSSTPRGEEIINLLIHLTDFSQNDHFTDKYYSDIPLDLSKALFIFSLNNMEKINPILRDRMMMIQTDNLSDKDKIIISKDYMIPKILQEINIKKEDIKIDEEVIKYAISNYSKEAGVRNLKRTYETLFEKINILRLVKFGENKEDQSKKLNFSSQMEKLILQTTAFPLTITTELLKMLVEENSINNKPPFMMYS